LAIFDLLRQGKQLKDKEKHDVKEIARALTQKLLDKELKVDHWADKLQTAAAVRKAITDYLYTKLPYPTYEDRDIQLKTDLVYEYLVGRYAA